MAIKITPEIQIQINELYVQCGVKAQVARELGISPATVSKYIIPNYKPLKSREIEIFNGSIKSVDEVVSMFVNGEIPKEIKTLSEKEWSELKHLQEEEI